MNRAFSVVNKLIGIAIAESRESTTAILDCGRPATAGWCCDIIATVIAAEFVAYDGLWWDQNMPVFDFAADRKLTAGRVSVDQPIRPREFIT
jgi:hypothetical protein